MRTKSTWLSALALVALAACGGGSKTDTTPATGGTGDEQAGTGEQGGVGGMPGDTAPLPAVPAQPAAEPEAVLAVLSLGEPTNQLASFAQFADSIQPGFGAMMNINQFMPMLAGAVGAPGLDGYAVDRPMWMVALDPKSGGSAVLVFAIGDEARLKGSVAGAAELMVHDGFAAVGTRGSLRVAGPWALSNLVSKAPPAELAMVIHMRRFMAGQGAEIEQALRASMGPSQRPEELKIAEGLFSVMNQIDRLEATLSAGATGMTANAWAVPVGQSNLAAFAAAQQATDYAFAARLPGSDWPMLYAARIDLGPFKPFFVEVAAAQGGPAAQVGQVFDLLGTEQAFGFGATKGKPRLAALMGVTDGKAAAALLDAALAAMAKSGPQAWDSMMATVKVGGLKVKGGALHELTFAPGNDASAEEKKAHAKQWPKGMKLFLGVVGNAMVAAMDADSKKLAQALAKNAAASPKPKYGKQTADAIAASMERKESGLVLVDVARLAADMDESGAAAAPAPKAGDLAPVAIGLGFEGGRVGGRLHLPSDQLKAIVQRGM